MRYVSAEFDPQLTLPVLGMGTYHLLDRVDEREAAASLHRALDAGVSFIDTSDNYMNEAELGESLAEYRGDTRPYIATKSGLATTYEEHLAMRAQGRQGDTSPERLRRQIDASLHRLGVRTLDLYQLHIHDDMTPAADVVEVMDDFIGTGKIRNWGVSNYSYDEFDELLDACDDMGVQRPATLQPIYGMLSVSWDDEAVELARSEGMLVLAHSPLLKGYLSDGVVDQISRLFDGARSDVEEEQILLDEVREANAQVGRLKDYANNRGHTLSELALAWTMIQPATVALNACVKPGHLESSLRAVDFTIDDEGFALIDEVRHHQAVVSHVPRLLAMVQRSKPYYAKRSA